MIKEEVAIMEEESVLRTSLVSRVVEPGVDAIVSWWELTYKLLGEGKKQLYLAGPLVAVSFLQYSLQVISTMFVGHLGELSLSGASLATSFAAVSGFSLQLGLASTLDTLCGQAHGAGEDQVLGIFMQRAMLVVSIASIPVSVIWAYVGHILRALGQDPEIASTAQLYAQWMIPSLFAYGFLQCQLKFLQTQNIVISLMVSSGITAVVHPFICWILVFKTHMGSKGAALANGLSYWINVLILALYIRFSPSCKNSWTGFSREAFGGLVRFLRLAVPSAVMVCLEYWSFEMVVLLSGLLPNPKLEMSVLSISINTMWLVYMIPFGLSSALSTRVSNELGAGHPQSAQLSVLVSFIITITEGIIIGSTTLLLKNVWGFMYTNEVEVAEYIAKMMLVLVISNFFDGIQCVLSGAARGCGWQKICAFINLGAYYGVAIPCAILFAFGCHLGGKGLWMGIICGLLVQVLMLLAICLRSNWEDEAMLTRKRLHDTTD